LLREPFEAVVSDAAFLATTAVRAPQVTRLLLCDLAEIKTIKNDGTINQFLVRPTTAEAAISAAQRTRLMNAWMSDPALRKLFAQMRKLPSIPAVYFRLLELMKSPDTNVEDIGRLIADEPALTVRVLQMVNSPFFGLGRTISNPAEAVGYLGLERTKSLVLLAQAFTLSAETNPGTLAIDELWRHSLLTGDFARRIASAEAHEARLADESYTGGVLHDVGKLMLAANLPQEYGGILRRSQNERRPLDLLEREILGATHAELGACALNIWGIPAGIVEAIAFHHQPDKHSGRSFSATLAVHAANALAHELRPEPTASAAPKLDKYYLEDLGMTKRSDRWREVCREAEAMKA
jgi:HD-like signal output (HDOD) protein